jgi:hypothetical protein
MSISSDLGKDGGHVSQVDPELGIIRASSLPPSRSAHYSNASFSKTNIVSGSDQKLGTDVLCNQEEAAAKFDEPVKAMGSKEGGPAVFDTSNITHDPQRSWVSRLREGKGFFAHYSLFFTSFFTILREGVESVVFLFGIGNAAPESIPISGAVGIICGISVGFLLYFSGKQVGLRGSGVIFSFR